MKKTIYLFATLLIFIACAKEEMQTNAVQDDAIQFMSNGNNKVDLCHYSDDDGTWHVISVNKNAVNAHLNHGDVILVDADGDGWVEAENECVLGGDCNDNDPAINPGAEEVCGDGIDNNCNDEVDEGCILTGCYETIYPEGFNSTSGDRFSREGTLTGNGCEPQEYWTYICFDYCSVECAEFIFAYESGGYYFCTYQTLDGVYSVIGITGDEAAALDVEITNIAQSLGLSDSNINCSNACANLKSGSDSNQLDPSNLMPMNPSDME